MATLAKVNLTNGDDVYTLPIPQYVLGLLGEDDISGSTDSDKVDGGGGNDTIYGDDGSDSLLGGAGNDLIDGGDGNDVITAGVGDDTVDGGNGGDLIKGDTGHDSLSGSSGNDTIDGGSGDDSMEGGDDDDRLLGGAGNDSMSGNDGNDYLDGGSGTDTMAGGDGNDVYLLQIQRMVHWDVIVENINQGIDTINLMTSSGVSTFTAPANIENVTRTAGTFGFEMVGNALDNRLEGSRGPETLDGALGDDTLVGGLGIDTFVISAGIDQVTDLGRGGADVLRVNLGSTVNATTVAVWKATASTYNDGAASITTPGFELDLRAVLFGNGFNMTNASSKNTRMYGSNLDDTLTGGTGNDTLFGWSGNDILTGGPCSDRFEITDGIDTVTDLSGTDVFVVAKVATGNLQLASDYIATTRSRNDGVATVFANGYNLDFSSVVVGQGFTFKNSRLDGTPSSTPVTVVGSGLDDTLYGGSGSDTLLGGAGDDSFIGGSAADSLDGGSGSDTFQFAASDNFADTVVGGVGIDTLQVMAFNASSQGPTAGTNISGIEVISLTEGSSFSAWSNILSVNSSLTTVRGTPGGVTETVTLYAPTKNWSTSSDTVSIAQLSAVVDATVKLEGSTSNDWLIGSRESDSLRGNAGDDTLDGGAGLDTLDGGAGNDTIVVKGGVDGGAESLDGGAGNDTLSVVGNMSYLSSNAVVKDFEAIAIAEGGRFAIEAAYLALPTSPPLANLKDFKGTSGGIDETVVFSNYTNDLYKAAVSTFDLSSATVDSNIIIEINFIAGDDTITGSPGRDSISGGNGNDSIVGGAGNDTLIGGLGVDSLTGGANKDFFRWESTTASEAPVVLPTATYSDAAQTIQSGWIDGAVETITDYDLSVDGVLDLPGTAVQAGNVPATATPISSLTSGPSSFSGRSFPSGAGAPAKAGLSNGVVVLYDSSGVPLTTAPTKGSGLTGWYLIDWVDVTQSLASASNTAAAFQYDGSTYVFFQNASTLDTDDLIIKLTGVIGITSLSGNNSGVLSQLTIG